ncbi:GNAT family N-acetyltransferase [Saccharopolyspora cebuensis]|uniref:GNAT family N-acetyltransferase n=1 Tax=Saccharopolyspora cebuensis TaxID=418759 RepID=A0ABV4CKZ8_9PSEU
MHRVEDWTIEAVERTDPDRALLLREYTGEMADRYYGRPATAAEVDAALAEDGSDDLVAPTGFLLVARHPGGLAGCVGLRLCPEAIGEVKRMYVRPGLRGRGLGGALLSDCARRAERLGVRTLRLDTRGDLVEARGLYAKHGFREVPAFNAGRYAEHWLARPVR